MAVDGSPLEGKKAVILTADQFEDMELFFPLFRLMEEAVDVTVAAPTKGPISGENGYSFEVETTIDEINPADYDLLIIPGGSRTGAPATVRRVARAQEIAKSFFAANNPSRPSVTDPTRWCRLGSSAAVDSRRIGTTACPRRSEGQAANGSIKQSWSTATS